MSDGNYTEVTTQGWMSRIANAFKGILTGIVLIVAATMLLFWNEGRTVKRAGAIAEAQSVLVNMPSITTIDANFNGKLVHATGIAKTEDVLRDTVLDISQKSLNLTREVEFYQWVESSTSQTEKNTGGSTTTTTTYHYDKEWTSTPINSSEFKEVAGHINVVNYAIESEKWKATNVTFGAYRLPAFLSNQVSADKPLTVALTPAAKLKLSLSAKNTMKSSGAYSAANPVEVVYVEGNEVYIGTNKTVPNIGDVRITYTYTPADTEVSLIAKTSGNTFVEYTAKNGELYSAISVGVHGAESLIAADKQSNTVTAWLLRFLGVFLVCIGLRLILAPVVVLADVLPILGDIADMGIKLVATVIGVAWSLIVIAIAWFFYRPVLAVVLIAAVIGLFMYLNKKRKVAKAAKTI